MVVWYVLCFVGKETMRRRVTHRLNRERTFIQKQSDTNTYVYIHKHTDGKSRHTTTGPEEQKQIKKNYQSYKIK